MAYLILVRHGESLWNAQGLWTGLTDIPLSEKGKQEAQNAGEKIKDFEIDELTTSALVRAKETGTIMLEAIRKQAPSIADKALNERDYGDFTGKNKWEIEKQVGKEEFIKIRRSWDFQIPNGESLKQVYERVIPYYESTILPKLKAGKNILIAAHGNSLRALVKYLDKVLDVDVSSIEIPTGQVIIYAINTDGTIASKEIR